jgi:AbrB family looped-hinge helix DNA binding protein
MPAVKLSPKFQVVIPLAVRESMGLVAGEKLQVIQLENRIELIPVRPMKSMRGAFPGIDTTIVRDPDRV